MKSRKYLNTLNGLTYWLEGGKVMVQKDDIIKESILSGSEFFVAVARDILVLIEEE